MKIRAALTARANILCGRALMSSQRRNRKAAMNRRRRRAALTVENAALKALSTSTTATGQRSATQANWRQIPVTAYFQRVSRGLKAAYFLALTGTRSPPGKVHSTTSMAASESTSPSELQAVQPLAGAVAPLVRTAEISDVLDSVTDSVQVIDANWRIAYMNKAA